MAFLRASANLATFLMLLCASNVNAQEAASPLQLASATADSENSSATEQPLAPAPSTSSVHTKLPFSAMLYDPRYLNASLPYESMHALIMPQIEV